MKQFLTTVLLIAALHYVAYSQKPTEGKVSNVITDKAVNNNSGQDLIDVSTVTAKSWSIMDSEGNLLWSYNGDTPRRAASTAKTMNALTVMRLAENDSAILDETVIVSEAAANTKGSTAKLEAGDKLKLKILLYAFLVPSGNDAGNVIAEHLSARLAPPDLIQFPPPKQNFVNLEELIYHKTLLRGPRANFVAEMNRNARSIGMENTFYVYSYGDCGDYALYTTTTNDLVKLGYEAFKYEIIRDIIAHKTFTYTVEQEDGSSREIELKNTNPLLFKTPPEGVVYDGIKTGTTTRAKACLIATGKKNGQRLFIAFTTSDSKKTRLTDAEKLFEAAWKKLDE